MDELTAEQLKELHADLIKLQASLHGALEAGADGAKPVDVDEPIGRISRGDAMQQQQMARATKQKNQLRLQQCEVALKAADNGEYGYCKLCEEPVGYKRLKARPETPFCLTCQTEREA